MGATRSGLAARQAALGLVDGVTREGRLLSEMSGRLARLEPQDRATAGRLALAALRGLERSDRLLRPLVRTMPAEPVRNIFRLALAELGDGGAAHAVVDAAVTLARQGKKTRGAAGLINAVLRKLAADMPDAWEAAPVPKLPRWLREPLVAAWGREAVVAMEAAHFTGAALDVTAKGDPAAVAAALGGTMLPTGSVRLRMPGQVSALPGFGTGDWWVQDAAAALPVKLLDPKPGERVLDLCAAPGGKTLQLAAAGAQVTAVDVSEARMARLRENLARCRLTASLNVGDALAVRDDRWDAVLVDAPCSATGTLRRHPDLPFAKDGSEFSGLFERQAAMLDHALKLVRPGGRVVYCTCSLLPDEGEVQVAEALARHGTVTLSSARPDAVLAAWEAEGGGFRTRPDHWPEHGGLDGFFMARLERR